MRIDYFGPGPLLDLAFEVPPLVNDGKLQILSQSATELVLRNPGTGVTTSFEGRGLPLSLSLGGLLKLDLGGLLGLNPRGLIQGWSSHDAAGHLLGTVSDLSWTLVDLLRGLTALHDHDDELPLLGLLGRQPILIDASRAVAGLTDLGLDLLEAPLSLLGSLLSDILRGGSNNDTITFTDNTGAIGDRYIATAGDDRLIFPDSKNPSGWLDLIYAELGAAITVTLDGPGNTGTIVKEGRGTDTLVNLKGMLHPGGAALSLAGTPGHDRFTVDVGAGNSLRLAGGDGVDVWKLALSGNLRLSFAGDGLHTAPQGAVVDLGSRRILNDGFGQAEILEITAGPGHLEIEGTDGADRLTGSTADESFILRGGTDTLDGGGGFDRLRYDHPLIQTGISADLASGLATGSWNGSAFRHELRNIEHLSGSRGDDRLLGGAAAELLDGREGHDRLEGRAGADSLYGGAGNDSLYGGAGNDRLYGGAGDDILDPGRSSRGGLEHLRTGTGSDQVIFTQVLSTAPGSGRILLDYAPMTGPITVTLDGAANSGRVQKSEGADTLVDIRRALSNQTEGLVLQGTAGADRYVIDGGAGSWLSIVAGGGADHFDLTPSGTLRLDFRGGPSPATQGLDIDLPEGVIRNDGSGARDSLILRSGTGRLELYGTRFADQIQGSAGRELFHSNGGNDTLAGGAGRDTLRYDGAEFETGVTVDLAAGTATGRAHGQSFSQKLSGIEEVVGTRFSDHLTGSAGADLLQGRAGNNTLHGGAGHDTLHGGDDSDTLQGGSGDDLIHGGTGSGDLRDVIYGGEGDDILFGGAGNDALHGGEGQDKIHGDGGSDSLIGNAGDDMLAGGAGADVLTGGAGDDFLNGGFGHDRLNGGAGAETFYHQGIRDHGSDWIQDYRAAEGDQLWVGLSGATRAQFQVNFATTANAGAAGVAEAFVIYRPTGQILFALVDGADQTKIALLLNDVVYDLLA